jgi:hypothetical protein
MKTFILASLLALTVASGVVVASQSAQAGYGSNCFVTRYGAIYCD